MSLNEEKFHTQKMQQAMYMKEAFASLAILNVELFSDIMHTSSLTGCT